MAKQFHSVKSMKKALQHGARNAIGPAYYWAPKHKTPAEDKRKEETRNDEHRKDLPGNDVRFGG